MAKEAQNQELSAKEQHLFRDAYLLQLEEEARMAENEPLIESSPLIDEPTRSSPAVFDLPTDETLERFADGTLLLWNRTAVHKAARASMPVAIAVAGFVRDYAPVRRLESSWMGWRGPALSAFGLPLLENVTEADWAAHLARCGRARFKENFLRWVTCQPLIGADGHLIRPKHARTSVLRLAGNLAAFFLVGILVGPQLIHPKKSTSPTTHEMGGPQLGTSKNAGSDPNSTSPHQFPAQTGSTEHPISLQAKDLSSCTIEDLDNVIGKLEGKKPVGIRPGTATYQDYLELVLLYKLRAERSSDPVTKRDYEDQANAAAQAAGLIQK